MSDNVLDAKEQQKLNKVAHNLCVPLAIAQSSMKNYVATRVKAYIIECVSDGMVSDAEWASIQDLLSRNAIEPALINDIATRIAPARVRWKIEYGELNEVPVGTMRLERGEKAVFVGRADWYENRKQRTSVDYAGLSGRIRLAKGFDFRYGSFGYSAPSVDTLTLIGTGKIVLTTDRLLFMSDSGDARSIKWKQLVVVEVRSWNEMFLQRPRGKSPVIDIKSAEGGLLHFGTMIAARLFKETGQSP